MKYREIYSAEYISKKATLLSIFAMMSVVLIHSTTLFTVENPAKWNLFAQFFITQSFTYWAVPFFFAMSGYWFANGSYVKHEHASWISFAKGKIRSLVVPYIIWNVVGGVMDLPLTIGNNLIMHRALFERTFLTGDNIWTIVDNLFAFTRFEPMGNGPLWYVRSLIILFCFAPMWRWIARIRFGWVLLLGICLIETLFLVEGVSILNLSAMSIGWFAIGIAISIKRWERIFPSKFALIMSACVWIGASLIKVLHAIGVDLFCGEVYSMIIALLPYGGVLFIWIVYDYLGGSQDSY